MIERVVAASKARDLAALTAALTTAGKPLADDPCMPAAKKVLSQLTAERALIDATHNARQDVIQKDIAELTPALQPHICGLARLRHDAVEVGCDCDSPTWTSTNRKALIMIDKLTTFDRRRKKARLCRALRFDVVRCGAMRSDARRAKLRHSHPPDPLTH